MALIFALLLAILAGYVDTAGFLALHGLFTAHVTGNFVTAGAALVNGSSGAIGKLLALPVFCIGVAGARVFGKAVLEKGLNAVALLLGIQAALLAAGAAFDIAFGPFPDADQPKALLAGLTLVAAMSVQNAMHRHHLGQSPPATLMTGNTTQLITDLVDIWRPGASQDTEALHIRCKRLLYSIVAFAAGCAAAALLYAIFPKACFVVPPVLALSALLISANTAPSR